MEEWLTKNIYRKSSLEKLSSPEQLDKVITVTSISAWLLLIGAAIIIVSFIFWAFMGEMTDEINIKGIYMDDGQIESVYSTRTGFVNKILVSTGKEILAGDSIAIVADEEVISEFNGTVNKIPVEEGQFVETGDQIFEIRRSNDNKKLVRSYVTLSTANELKENLPVAFIPSGIEEEKYGHMTGYIESIGTFTVSEEEMYRKLGDDLLVDFFRGNEVNEPVVEIIMTIHTDVSSENGYKWSNKKGGNVPIANYSYMSVRIIKDRQKPVEKLLGLYP